MQTPPPLPSYRLWMSLIAGLLVASTTAALATPDVELKVGIVQGTITVPKSDAVPVARQFVFSGASGALAMVQDLNDSCFMYLQWALTADNTTKTVVQQGLDIGFAYHLLGGRRYERTGQDNFYVDSRYSSNLSLLLQVGQHQYATSDTSVATSSSSDLVTGGVLDISSGLEYRRDIGLSQAVGAAFLVTLMDFSMSTSKLAATTKQIFLFWRFTF